MQTEETVLGTDIPAAFGITLLEHRRNPTAADMAVYGLTYLVDHPEDALPASALTQPITTGGTMQLRLAEPALAEDLLTEVRVVCPTDLGQALILWRQSQPGCHSLEGVTEYIVPFHRLILFWVGETVRALRSVIVSSEEHPSYYSPFYLHKKGHV
jgi:hypothetical protein